MLDRAFARFLYCGTMWGGRMRSFFAWNRPFGCALVLSIGLAACSGKPIQYPEDHERFRRIDQAVESLRESYQKKDRSGFQAVMLPLDHLERLQREADADFDAFQTISLEFKIERIMIDGDAIDVYVHWQGVWKKDPDDAGVRQRGHARLQWVGTHSVLLRAVQGDLPFGMKTRQALSELSLSPTTSR